MNILEPIFLSHIVSKIFTSAPPRITAIPYPGFGVLINIVSKEDITYHVTIGDMPHCTCPYFTKMSS